jgi:O-antigen biosynthesis protein
MFKPLKVIDIEISRPQSDLVKLNGYVKVHALVRLHGAPIGYVKLPVIGGRYLAHALKKAILEKHVGTIVRSLVAEKLATPLASLLRREDLFGPPRADDLPRPSTLVTVAICTRDRASDLRLCLDSLSLLDYPAIDIIVVDNAPATDATERLVRENYPFVRYVREPRPGLDWARNRAIIEARGEIIAYTDDDVVVEPGWVSALVRIFAENPEVMAVTGLVVPYELETEAQLLFELYGGFGRGIDQKWVQLSSADPKNVAGLHGGTGKFGTGANMAFRRRVFELIGDFDPALDVGTVTNGGGDLEMFFRVIKEGHGLVYEPNAIVRHRHRREYAELHSQLTNWGIGFYSYLVRSALSYPDERAAFIKLGFWWIWRHFRVLMRVSVRPSLVKKDLILAEIRGAFIGLFRYQKARANAAEILKTFGPQTAERMNEKVSPCSEPPDHDQATAVRTIELSKFIHPLADLHGYSHVRLIVTWQGRPLGSVNIHDVNSTLSTYRIRYEIANGMTLDLFLPDYNILNKDFLWSNIMEAFFRHYLPDLEETPDAPQSSTVRLPSDIQVSVVVATVDRPDDLRRCLGFLTRQNSSRQVEIIVVDNNPTSGLTAPVVAEFPGVLLTFERRKGLSYARNKGIVVSKGSIIAVTDDDAAMPDDWLENLVAPFVQDNVMVVTGNVLPMELETPAQHLFEVYGGLGRGFTRQEADIDWFEAFRRKAVPTWQLGATACAAFRANIFSHPSIGLFDEALGAGTPTGCSEDTYLFYKVLKEGYTIVYEPLAYVWHKHRRDMSELRRQIYNYSKGHVAYHLTTLLRDRDLRALIRILIELPRYHASRIKYHLFGRGIYPFSLTFLEIAGNLMGGWALWRSRKRVKHLGLSSTL